MHYVLLVHAAESLRAARSPAQAHEVTQEYVVYAQALRATGRAGDSAALEFTSTATTVRVREGKRSIQDGPFAETREQLAGYFALKAESEAEALDWAARIPDADVGTIEVRPLPEVRLPPAPELAEMPKIDPAQCKQYLLLIYVDEQVMAAMSEAERSAFYGRYFRLTHELKAAGQHIAGTPLESVKRAKTVHLDGAKRVVRDGPFAETREQLGGYYRVYAKDLDDACSVAARIPGAEIGTVEVRPVRDMSAYYV
jgi:hypothetical protein